MTEKQFPILVPYQHERTYGGPRSIPWALIAPHEAQAQRNHYQTLQRLAERGGLAPSEAVAVLEDRQFQDMEWTDSVCRLLELLP